MNYFRRNFCRALSFMVFMSAVSCSDWLDVNDNPDTPTDVEYTEFLAAGISSVAYVMGGRYQVLGALWSQHWTQSPGASQYSGIDSYDINSSTYDDNQFGSLYSGALKNFEYVRTESLKDERYDYYLISTVMQAYTFQVLADLYDEIPFSQALKGDEGIIQPKYESGKDVYDSLIARIDYALSLDYDAEDYDNIGTRDLVFNGSIQKWVAFANTLKLRMYIRQSLAKPEYARQGVEKLYSDKTKFLSEDACVSIYANSSGKRNPLYETEMVSFSSNPNLVLSYTFYSFMVFNRDNERLDTLFNVPSNGASHKALPQGDYYAPNESSGINSNSYSKPLMLHNAPVYLISYSESCFLQAEAIARYQVKDYITLKEKYDEGVKSSFRRLLGEENADEAANPLLEDIYALPADGSSTDEFISDIITQKWVALSGIQNLELFFEQNRTGIPKISSVSAENSNYIPGEYTVSVNNVTSGKFPKRLIFHESEYTTNKNTPSKKDVSVPVWWDVE